MKSRTAQRSRVGSEFLRQDSVPSGSTICSLRYTVDHHELDALFPKEIEHSVFHLRRCIPERLNFRSVVKYQAEQEILLTVAATGISATIFAPSILAHSALMASPIQAIRSPGRRPASFIRCAIMPLTFRSDSRRCTRSSGRAVQEIVSRSRRKTRQQVKPIAERHNSQCCERSAGDREMLARMHIQITRKLPAT